MRLADAANAFNTMPCTDAYTGAPCFKAQLGLYDDSKRDSETAARRVLSVAGDAAIPTRRVIAAARSRWIVGHGNPDTFRDEVIRVGYTIHEAPYLARVRTLAQACLDQLGFTAYSGRTWIKDSAFTEQSSRLTPVYHLHFASNEPVREDQVVLMDNQLFLVRAINLGAAGTLVALCDQMANDCIEVASVQNGPWDPVTNTHAGGAVSVRLLRMRWQSLFRYHSSAAPTFGPEDIQLAIAKASLTVRTGATVTFSQGVFKLASVASEGDVWLCRAVRHG